MAPRPPEIYGIPISELARICHVSIKTATRWKNGSTCPPKTALLLLTGDLGCLDSGWAGWRIHKGVLISPEGWEITKGDVISSPLLRQQLAAFKTELRRLKEAAVSIQDQPLPAEFPEWIRELEVVTFRSIKT
jgi:Phage protein